jgi:hypothetical protein
MTENDFVRGPGGGRPMGIVETRSITPLTLSQMDEAFSAAYAEWPDHTSFVQGMIEWYQSVDPGFTAETPLLAERFRVIWPTPKSPA